MIEKEMEGVLCVGYSYRFCVHGEYNSRRDIIMRKGWSYFAALQPFAMLSK